MSAFGLVLGGGGPIGAAWFAGLASGLADEGLDLGDADAVIGTSAGAWAGAWVSAERSGEFVDAMRRLGAGFEPLALDVDLISQVSSVMGRAEASSWATRHPTNQRAPPCRLPPTVVRSYAKYLPGYRVARAVPCPGGEGPNWPTPSARTALTKYPLKLASPHLVPLPVSSPSCPS